MSATVGFAAKALQWQSRRVGLIARHSALRQWRSAASTGKTSVENRISATTPVHFVLRAGIRLVRVTCTVTGAVTLAGIGFGTLPWLAARAPLSAEEKESLRDELEDLCGSGEDSAPTSADEAWAALKAWHFPRFTFRDLQRPLFMLAFIEAARFTFAAYADAAGVMTSDEFRCAVHKMVDLSLTIYSFYDSRRETGPDGAIEVTPALRARATAEAARCLTNRVAPAAFRVIDLNGDGEISAREFTGAVLLVLAALEGASSDTPGLQRLAFRIADIDGDGIVSLKELTHWVKLALEYDVLPPGSNHEARGPCGLFGTRILTAERLAKKWLRGADVDKDGGLSLPEFALLAPTLRMHEVVRRLARGFAERRVSVAGLAA